MDNIIGCGTRVFADEKTDHADIGEKEEQREPPPGIVQCKEKIKRQKDERKLFQFDECFHVYHLGKAGS
jgi:hypothetical protein